MRNRFTLLMFVLCVLSASALGEEVLREFSWSALDAAGTLGQGRIAPQGECGPFECFIVANDIETATTVLAVTIDAPGVTKGVYAIRGQVSCDGVEGKGYLEMWSHFAAGERFFTRGLADSGPMGCLSGTQDWREFSLPFTVTDGAARPGKLVLNVVLPSRGTVRLGHLRLVQYDEAEDPLAATGQWFSGSAAGIIGGVFGALFGCLGGLIGLLSTRGKGRRFALTSLKVTAGVGAVAVAVGLAAVVRSQPYAVYYPLLLIGGLLTALPLGLLPTVRKRYEQVELRKIKAMDAS